MGRWAQGAQCAVMLTFDVDAETLWLAGSTGQRHRLGLLSQGTYGARVGVPLVLHALRRFALKATFFVPGWVAEHHPDIVAAIVDQGHEIGHHGYMHEDVTELSEDDERRVLERGIEALRRVGGQTPVGYRAPSWELTSRTLRLLEEYGFRYSSNLMSHFLPWQHPDTHVIELPVQWLLDDAPFFLFRPGPGSRPIQPAQQAFQAWAEEFQGIYRFGGLFNLTLHPEFIGRPGRLLMLERLLEHLLSYPRVWVATGREVAEYWAAHLASNPEEWRQGLVYDPITHR
ncbi:MAG: polysaccharide deacetylase [Thermomicrobium sp.]|nr:polysaccharide deacetylase [Thermomicrobium sp.]